MKERFAVIDQIKVFKLFLEIEPVDEEALNQNINQLKSEFFTCMTMNDYQQLSITEIDIKKVPEEEK